MIVTTSSAPSVHIVRQRQPIYKPNCFLSGPEAPSVWPSTNLKRPLAIPILRLKRLTALMVGPKLDLTNASQPIICRSSYPFLTLSGVPLDGSWLIRRSTTKHLEKSRQIISISGENVKRVGVNGRCRYRTSFLFKCCSLRCDVHAAFTYHDSISKSNDTPRYGSRILGWLISLLQLDLSYNPSQLKLGVQRLGNC